MFINRLKGIGILVVLISFYGCASKGIEVKSYIQERERVDQSLTGNAGYIDGSPQHQMPTKSTRQIIVVEVIKDNKIDMEEKAATVKKEKKGTDELSLGTPVVSGQTKPSKSVPTSSGASSDSWDQVKKTVVTTVPKIQQESKLSNFVEPATEADGYTEYKVEKDDTLQKISKKFYDSYSKWIKIYEANKDVIKNPDRIKPGITIKIPKL